MKIIKSKLWKQPDIVKTIFKNVPPLDPTVLFFNPNVYFIRKKNKIVSFLTVKNHKNFYEIKTLCTIKNHRNKGYSSKLLSTNFKNSELVLQCDKKLESYYKKFGFNETKKIFGIKTSLFNIFLRSLLGYKLITMQKNNTLKFK